MTEANKPAFPIWTEDMPVVGDSGLSKREYYAAKAMNGLVQSAFRYSVEHPDHGIQSATEEAQRIIKDVAGISYMLADDMLKETERQNDLRALVERVADMPPSMGKVELIDVVDEARRILGRSEEKL